MNSADREEEMKLTAVERAILINQFEIRKALSPQKPGLFEEEIEILRSGFVARYALVVGSLAPDEEVSQEDCEFVSAVVQLHRLIEFYRQQNPDDKTVAEFHFEGFDGNNEGELMAYSRFLIERRGFYDELKPHEDKSDGFNSHSEMRSRYEGMLRRWEALGKPTQPTTEQVREILSRAS